MQEKVLNGRIYKGSDAEITVELFPPCATVVGYTDLSLSFYTDGEKSIERSQDEVTISGETAIVTFAKEELDTINDGVIKYKVQYTASGAQTVTEMQTGWYLKTPSSYTPGEFPSKSEIEQLVEEDVEIAMTGYTKTTEFATVDGNPITNGGNIPLDRVITLNSMIGEVTVTGTSGVTKDLKNKIVTVIVPTKTSELDNDAGFLTEHQDISGKVDNVSGVQGIWSGTQAEYDALGTYSDTTLYIIKKDE